VICSLFYYFENCDGEPFHFDIAKTVELSLLVLLRIWG
jgi:hypothetical protein